MRKMSKQRKFATIRHILLGQKSDADVTLFRNDLLVYRRCSMSISWAICWARSKIFSASSQKRTESADDADVPSPIFYSFYELRLNESIMNMPNFTPVEFQELCNALHDHIVAVLNLGWGKRSGKKPFDSCSCICSSWNAKVRRIDMGIV